MIAILHNDLRHHEGVVAVRPCYGLGPCIAVVKLPAGGIGVVDGPMDTQGLAGFGIFLKDRHKGGILSKRHRL